jgi:hypothetical protein
LRIALKKGSEIVTDRRGKGPLTEASMLDLLLRLRKDGKQLNHYFRDNLRHQRAQRDLGIDFEAFEEAPDTFKEL